jgi:formylglycine-generating enzyme required for sulfatase activity
MVFIVPVENKMKKILVLAITWMLPLSLGACGSNNRVTTNSTWQTGQSATPSISKQVTTKENAAQTPSTAEFALINGRTFTMGSPSWEVDWRDDETQQIRVRTGQDFKGNPDLIGRFFL